MLRSGVLLVALTAALSACGPAALYQPREGQCPARPAHCSFALISGGNPQPYEVVGVIDIAAFSARKLPHDEASFRAAIGAEVCRVGGDAVIAGINFDGRYVLATVVKWADDKTPKPVCPKPSKDAGTPKGAKGDAGVGSDAAVVSHEAGASDAATLDAGQAGHP